MTKKLKSSEVVFQPKYRAVSSKEIELCPQHRLDAGHYIPRHKVEDCGASEIKKPKVKSL